jgi:hypothetical protein
MQQEGSSIMGVKGSAGCAPVLGVRPAPGQSRARSAAQHVREHACTKQAGKAHLHSCSMCSTLATTGQNFMSTSCSSRGGRMTPPPEPSTNPPLSMTTQHQRGVHRGFQQRRRLAAQLPAIQLPRPPAAQLLSPVEALADGPHTWLQGPAVQAPGQLRSLGGHHDGGAAMPALQQVEGSSTRRRGLLPKRRSWPGACTAGP